MNNYVKFIGSGLVLLLVVACSEPEPNTMSLNTSYIVDKGDYVLRDSPDALVEVVTDLVTKQTTVTLKRGKASIVNID